MSQWVPHQAIRKFRVIQNDKIKGKEQVVKVQGAVEELGCLMYFNQNIKLAMAKTIPISQTLCFLVLLTKSKLGGMLA